MNDAINEGLLLFRYFDRKVEFPSKLSRGNLRRFARKLRAAIAEKYSVKDVALPGQMVGLSGTEKKTAALFFDRVWFAPGMEDPPPGDISLFGATSNEVWFLLLILSTMYVVNYVEPGKRDQALLTLIDGVPFEFDLTPSAKAISQSLFADQGVVAVPMFSSELNRDAQYQPGATETIIAAINGLGLINEKTLTWDQVIEFRKDNEARTKIRRLRNWLDAEATGKSVSQVSDLLATKLDDYEWAIKKHGIETITGSLSELLDPKLLSATSATMAGLAYSEGGLWAALAGAAIVVGKVSISVTQKMLDLKDRRRGQGAEVAFVHEIKKLTK